ncbi:cholesterol oxidase [Nocardia transvalensis]|uniref:Cholesterol oxidase n=1 Tax=Nocardia transvalensis TaxID=37333 RepID=A0A7W9UKI9_9NOCA|nr:alpha/beta hydrolase [Nocardia transvalensis]MBB5916608.1 cholesterol oxidase [Nocardia transvalensis]
MTLAGTVYEFGTDDGLLLRLTRFRRADCDDVVLLVHGHMMSSDMFILPEQDRNLTTFLLDNGFTDVWALDFRMSKRLPYNGETRDDTLDDIALFDHPAAMRELRRHIGDRRVHVVAHCLGSMSFAMSVFGGTVRDVTSLVCNSVGLTPRVPLWARVKGLLGPPLLGELLGFTTLDPRYASARPLSRARLFSRLVSWGHRECDEPACHMVSFLCGSGNPVLYEHANLHPATHARITELFGPTGLSYFRHVYRMIEAGRAVKYHPDDPTYARLPDDYLAGAAAVATPVLMLESELNRTFPGSNPIWFRRLEELRPGLQELETIVGYGHMDSLAGRYAHVDVYPRIADFLKRMSR